MSRLIVLLSVFVMGHSALAEPVRPHIIFILADDMGVGDVGCYGGEIVPTPHIDRLADEGVRFGD